MICAMIGPLHTRTSPSGIEGQLWMPDIAQLVSVNVSVGRYVAHAS